MRKEGKEEKRRQRRAKSQNLSWMCEQHKLPMIRTYMGAADPTLHHSIENTLHSSNGDCRPYLPATVNALVLHLHTSRHDLSQLTLVLADEIPGTQKKQSCEFLEQKALVQCIDAYSWDSTTTSGMAKVSSYFDMETPNNCKKERGRSNSRASELLAVSSQNAAGRRPGGRTQQDTGTTHPVQG